MRKIVTWTLSILLAFAFFGAGLGKLTAQPMMVQEFALFGYPPWFMYVTGGLELLAMVLVLIPRTAAIGAGVVTCIMIGAVYSHLTHGQWLMSVGPLVLLVMAVVLGWLRGWSVPPFAASRA
jgi:uncharacterized membrane protein YphA (DoxX/SURF4 family)